MTLKPNTFCSLSENNRQDTITQLLPVFVWLKNHNPNIHRIHMLGDSPVNQ